MNKKDKKEIEEIINEKLKNIKVEIKNLKEKIKNNPNFDDYFGEDLMDLKGKDKEMLSKALNRAHDIRKFEIELYWKRSNQMYIIVGALLTAFMGLVNYDKYIMATVISALGTIVSFAWIHVNKGSKFWQENWESHIDMLENQIEGNLYKVVNITEKENAYSVSRINKLISWIFFISWFSTSLIFMLAVDLEKSKKIIIFRNWTKICDNWGVENYISLIIAVFLILGLSRICCYSKTEINNQVKNYKFTFRKVGIQKDETEDDKKNETEDKKENCCKLLLKEIFLGWKR